MNMALARPIEILLVEDNLGDIHLAREALRDCKILNNLHVARDGEGAMDFLLHRGAFQGAPRPDLVLLDLNLPGKDGREVLRDVKSSSELRRIPVVVLTTSSAEEDILRSYDSYANCYITKPVDLEGLSKVVTMIEDFWFSIVRLPSA